MNFTLYENFTFNKLKTSHAVNHLKKQMIFPPLCFCQKKPMKRKLVGRFEKRWSLPAKKWICAYLLEFNNSKSWFFVWWYDVRSSMRHNQAVLKNKNRKCAFLCLSISLEKRKVSKLNQFFHYRTTSASLLQFIRHPLHRIF